MKQISTRSQPPRAVRQVLRRSLLAGLNGVGLRRLSVIAAPPGYGKTSLAGQWFAKSNAGGARARWISLSAEDGNLSHFMLSILTELDRAAGRPERMSDIARRAGFVQEGIYREEIHLDGKWYNTYRYGMLESEYAAFLAKNTTAHNVMTQSG